MSEASSMAMLGAAVSICGAVISGVFLLWNSRKTATSSLEMQRLKGDVDANLERLKAKLSHRQSVTSTQWSTEFKAYQDIWKGMVTVRTMAMKIVLRGDELVDLGLPNEYLASSARAEIRKKLIKEFVGATKILLLAIHESAPFYPSAIRRTANETHQNARALFDLQMQAIGQFVVEDEKFAVNCKISLQAIIDGVDRVESLIRERLAAVEVLDGAKG